MLPLMALALAQDPAAALEQAEVVQARHALFRGQMVGLDDIRTGRMRAHQVPADVVTDPSEVVGRVLLAPVYEGSLLRLARFAPPEAGMGVEALLPKGHRLFTYPLATPDASFRPGNLVDIVDVAGGCAVVEQADVLAVRRGGNRVVDTTLSGEVDALELSLAVSVIPRIANTEGLAVLLRNAIDLGDSELPPCSSDETDEASEAPPP